MVNKIRTRDGTPTTGVLTALPTDPHGLGAFYYGWGLARALPSNYPFPIPAEWAEQFLAGYDAARKRTRGELTRRFPL